MTNPLPLGLGIVDRAALAPHNRLCYVMARSHMRGDYYFPINHCPFCGNPLNLPLRTNA